MSAIDIPADFAALHDREWDRLSSPGTWFTGAERVAIAAAARGEAASSPAERAAQMVSTAPETITRDWFDTLLADGLSVEQYVEVLGIVARLRALDTTRFGLGHFPRPLPEPRDGDPTPVTTEAVIDGRGYQRSALPSRPPFSVRCRPRTRRCSTSTPRSISRRTAIPTATRWAT